MPTTTATVLVADDDATGRDAFSWLLQDAGFQVYQASTGQEALQLTADREPQLIILDVILPDLEGYEVCRRIKANPATASTLVLMVSGLRNRFEDRVVGLEGGADGFLAKPVEPTELVAQVRALLRVRRAEETMARDALLLASVRDAVIVTEPGGKVTYWNEGAARLFGWQAGEVMGRPLAERFAKPERVAAGKEWLDRRKDGSEVWVEGHVSPIADAADRLAGFLWLAHDVSDRKRAEAERESLIGQLREALSAVKTMRGLLPICAWCKQVRSDEGYWQKLEAYLEDQFDLSVTHGICPACAQKLVLEGLQAGTKEA